MKKAIIFVMVLSTMAISSNNVFGEWDIYLKSGNFTWKEYGSNSSKLLEEYGRLYGVGISGKTALNEINNKLTARGRIEVFDGTIDYDGQTQAGLPAKTETDYRGNKIDSSLGWKVNVTNQLSFEPFAGLGHVRWVRKIRGTENIIGYDEIWRSFYSSIGFYSDYASRSQLKIFAEITLKIPLDNELETGLGGGTKIKPGEKKSIFSEIGIQHSRFKASVYYESMEFSKSKTDAFSGIYQPESKGRIYGLSIGIVF
jgi:hypothetical protein